MTAATFKVFYDYGGTDNTPGTAENVTDNGTNKIRFKQADNNTIDTNNPIPVPDTAVNYSYWKQIYLKCINIQDATQIDNIQFYGDGTVFSETDVELIVSTATPTKTSVSDAGYDVADASTTMTKHTDVTATANADDYTSGAALSVSISEGSNIIDATNETSDYVILQLEVGSTAASGILTAETLTYQYDEI
ncbi:hypothetical protein LCGC14_1870230 [marine sediment metagenome]|uniref:Uncharacterized protein n=1 Tax=marine sediment metagenome TaxID=412755 RepID=A0A0F9J401_9ZZZZ